MMAVGVSVLVTPPTEEPITLAEAKLRAGLDWPIGDQRDAMMSGFIAAARQRVELDTGLALLTQTRDVYFDSLPFAGAPVALPSQSRPLQSITSIQLLDLEGAGTVVDPSAYVLDSAAGRLTLATNEAYAGELGTFHPWVARIVAGWASPAQLRAQAPLLVHAVALLAAHYATAGRDVVNIGHIVAELPYGYEDAIAPFRAVTVI